MTDSDTPRIAPATESASLPGACPTCGHITIRDTALYEALTDSDTPRTATERLRAFIEANDTNPDEDMVDVLDAALAEAAQPVPLDVEKRQNAQHFLDLQSLRQKALDPAYSDEWIGIAFRALAARLAEGTDR